MIYGFNFIAFGVTGILGPIIISSMSGGDSSSLDVTFGVLFWLGTGLTIISLIICIFIKIPKDPVS